MPHKTICYIKRPVYRVNKSLHLLLCDLYSSITQKKDVVEDILRRDMGDGDTIETQDEVDGIYKYLCGFHDVLNKAELVTPDIGDAHYMYRLPVIEMHLSLMFFHYRLTKKHIIELLKEKYPELISDEELADKGELEPTKTWGSIFAYAFGNFLVNVIFYVDEIYYNGRFTQKKPRNEKIHSSEPC